MSRVTSRVGDKGRVPFYLRVAVRVFIREVWIFRRVGARRSAMLARADMNVVDGEACESVWSFFPAVKLRGSALGVIVQRSAAGFPRAAGVMHTIPF